MASLPTTLKYGQPGGMFWLEYDQRVGHYSMDVDHIHGQLELYYLFSGERHYFIKDRTHTIHEGSLVAIPGNEVHKTSDTGIPNHERIVLYFQPDYFRPFAPEEAELLLTPFRGDSPVLRLSSSEKLIAEQLLYGLLHELQEQDPGSEIAVRQAAVSVLLLAARHRLRAEAEPAAEEISPAAQKVMETARYITAHYHEPLTLGELSRQFYVSPSYLSRSFRKHTGFGLVEYIGITRVKEAQRLLRETDERVTDIAGSVGFESLSHFEKVFKSFAKQSPRSYRSQFR